MKGDPDNLDWILERVEAGEVSTGELLEKVYGELRSIAGQMMRSERAAHTLQPTALVNEAFLRLAASPSDSSSPDRLGFLAAAACAMRRVLIDHARGRNASKRGGSWNRVTLMGLDEMAEEGGDEIDLLLLDESLGKLTELDPRQAHIVELRFFSGMSGQEIADHLGVSRNTVVRELTLARAWLQRELTRGS